MPWFGGHSSKQVDKQAILREIQLQLPAIVQVNSQRVYWPGRPTGIYGEAAAGQAQGTTDYGILVLLEIGGRVVAISTTNNSFWTGTWIAGKIEATYVNQHATTGTLNLQLGADGSHVMGTWRVRGDAGDYKAYRTAGFDQETVMQKLEGIPVR